jgi:hypothetical protein
VPANDRGGLKTAFLNFKKSEADRAAELKLLGRTVEEPHDLAPEEPKPIADSYPVATSHLPVVNGLQPRPLTHREAVRQLSFRCPHSLATELRRKAAYNQLEQQQVIIEGLRRVLAELPDPPPDWQD